jgi:short-subunit dehydrogenase
MNIVITGAARGIGKAIAAKFAAEGHTLFLCSRSIDTLQTTADELKKLYTSANIQLMQADLSDKTQTEKFANWCLQIAVPDVLINNAGGFTPGNILDEPEGSLENMINNNLYSAYYLTKFLAPQMKINGSGHIFNICSVAALQAYNGGGSYSISKFALNGFSQNLRHELKDHNIKVTAIFPGAVFTDSWAGFDNSNNRIMEPADIAEIILSCTKLSAAAVPEEIILRPQLGDL